MALSLTSATAMAGPITWSQPEGDLTQFTATAAIGSDSGLLKPGGVQTQETCEWEGRRLVEHNAILVQERCEAQAQTSVELSNGRTDFYAEANTRFTEQLAIEANHEGLSLELNTKVGQSVYLAQTSPKSGPIHLDEVEAASSRDLAVSNTWMEIPFHLDRHTTLTMAQKGTLRMGKNTVAAQYTGVVWCLRSESGEPLNSCTNFFYHTAQPTQKLARSYDLAPGDYSVRVMVAQGSWLWADINNHGQPTGESARSLSSSDSYQFTLTTTEAR